MLLVVVEIRRPQTQAVRESRYPSQIAHSLGTALRHVVMKRYSTALADLEALRFESNEECPNH